MIKRFGTQMRFGLVVAAPLVAAIAACGGSSGGSSSSSSSSSSAAATVTAHDFAFSPSSVSVASGAQVSITFQNSGSVRHSFTASSVGADAEAAPGENKTVSFTAPGSGSVSFHCKFHAQMTGTISIGGAGAGAGASSSASPSSGGYGY